MSPSEPLLQIHELDARYGPIQALRQVSLHIDSGEIVTLIGANGAGKSTLLMSLFGDPQPAGGWIRYQGHDITGLPTHQIAKRGIAQAPEGRRIFAAMSVEENLLMGAIPVGMDHMDADLIKVFELFPRLKERRNQRAGTLSGGEQQMLAIGRALMQNPRVLLLDEPSMGLAPLLVEEIFNIIRRLNAEQQTTILLVEQNAQAALQVAHRAYVLETGRISMSGDAQTLLNDPAVIDAYLGL